MSDNRGASLVHAPDYHPNVRTIPRKKPATIDNVQELESDNAPRKPRLAAHTSRAGVSNNRPGRVTKYTTELETRTTKMNTDYDLDIEDVLLAKIEDGDLDGADQLLDNEIQKLSADIAKKGKKKPPPPPSNDAEDNFDNADDEDVEDNLDKHEAQVALARSLHTLESDTDQAMRVARIAEAPGAHPLRKLAVQSTLDALKSDMKKLGGIQPVRYPHGAETDLQDHQNMTNTVTRTGERGQSSRQTSVTPVIQSPGRHRFDDLVDAVRARDGGSRSKAFTVARLENPDVYDAYQAWHSGNTTQQQRAVQQETNDLTTKAAPLTFEAAVNAEIRKGHNPRVAAQRVMNHYGNDLPRESFAKAADVAADWREAAQEIIDRDPGLSRVEALQKCRQEHPELFRELQGR